LALCCIYLLSICVCVCVCVFSRSSPHGWEVISRAERPTQIPEEGARKRHPHRESFGAVKSHHTRLANTYCEGHDAQTGTCIISQTTKGSRYVCCGKLQTVVRQFRNLDARRACVYVVSPEHMTHKKSSGTWCSWVLKFVVLIIWGFDNSWLFLTSRVWDHVAGDSAFLTLHHCMNHYQLIQALNFLTV
jgi:hypothetical protein